MKSSTFTCAAWSISLFALLVAVPAKAADLAYAGRLVDAEGAPLTGPIDISLRFYGSAAGSDQLGPTKTFDGVTLEGGVFQLTVALEAQDQAAVFGDGTAVVFVEVEAAGKLYPRQRFTPVPLAMRIPVDNDSLVYGPDAKLTVGEIAMGQVQGLQTALAQKLDSTPASASASGYLSSADWAAFNAKQAAITTSSSLTAGSIATASQDAVVLKPYGTQAGQTGELRFEEKTGGNYVGFKAPDTLAADSVWTLPATVGNAGELLVTDGAGALSWAKIAGANILDATITDAKLQTITTAGKVSGAAITAGTIGGSAAFAGTGGVTTSGNVTLSPAASAATQLRFQDDDASNYVAFKAPSTVASDLILTLPAADGAAGQFLRTNGSGTLTWGSPAGSGDMLASANLSDLTNAATARTNLGLGALATLAAVGSSEITNDSIVNADVAPTAAIATSKLSGALTAISGHGLGALANMSNITSSEITDATIVNADVSTSAAIATSKLSGAVSAIAGHGLGSLASLSSVTAAEIGDGTIADADISASAAIATSKLSGPLTAVSGHGLGGLAALSAVSSTEITNATIVDADISGTAAIATSKLSGGVTSITGHGLGALATLSAVGTGEITDGTIANADVSGSAAIATSKLSGALTAVSGHGLGSLAALSAVSTTEITDGTIANADIAATAAIDASKIASGSVSSTEFQYLDGLTSSIQTQLDAKASAANPTFTGAITADAGSAAAPSYSFTGDSNTGVWSSGADTVNLSTGGSERLRVTSAGNVGIGTTAPGSALDVNGIITSRDNMTVGYQSGASGGVYITKASQYGKPSMQAVTSAFGGDSLLLNPAAGNVGIGTTSPAATLDVAGSLRASSIISSSISSDGGGELRLVNPSKTAANTAYYWALFNMTGIYGNSLQFWNYDTTACSGGMCASRFTILDNGNVGIGTTAPSALLDVAGDAVIGNTSTTSLTRTMPIVVNDTVDLGSFTIASGAVALDISAVVSNTSFSVSKRYAITLKYNQTANTWTIVQPLADSGPWNGSQDFALDVNVNNGVASLRLRRTQGAVAGTAYVTIERNGRTDTTFTASTATASVTAPSTLLSTTALGAVAGNVGIGTTIPSSKLQIASGSADGITISGSGTTKSRFGQAATADDFQWRTNAAFPGASTQDDPSKPSWAMRMGAVADDLSIFRAPAGAATSWSQVFTVTGAGNVGIGTTSPGSLLHVNGNIQLGNYFTSAGSRYVGLASNSNAFGVDGASGMEIESFTDGGNYSQKLHFWTHDFLAGTGSRKMTVSETGNVGIGTTSPSYLLHVNGSVAGVGAYNQLSDERYKKDIADISDSLEKVLAIHGVTYKWIDEEKFGSETQIGVIAQEIEKIVPEVVTTGSDGVKRVRYSDLVPLLIEAFKHEHASSQQLKAESEQLKAESERLKAESEQLKTAFCSKFPEMPFCSR